MIITKQIGKIHYWKLFGKVRPHHVREASKELLTLFDQGKIEVCVADTKDVKIKNVSREVLKDTSFWDHSRKIPTFLSGTNSFIRLSIKILKKLYPVSTSNIMIVDTKEEAFKLAEKLISEPT